MASLLQWASTYTGPVGKDDIQEIFAYCLKRTLSLLKDGISQAPEIAESVSELGWDDFTLKKYIFNTIINENGSPKTIEINKRNIEFRTGVEATNFFIPSLDLEQQVFDVYGLADIFLDMIVYRVGRYSYYAVQINPFFKEQPYNPRPTTC